jgi:aryl-alcohol dehydrogenase-like predicted oxidoreductase
MEHRKFGKTDMTVSVLGFGGAEIGFEGASDETVERLLGDALDAGLNVIDTAECYMDSEEKIGRAVAHRRGDFHLFTKCGHPDGADKPGNWTPDSLLKSIERSLKRLQVEHIDLVQLHSCSEDELRKGDVISALKTARDKGYTRYIGYSGDGQAAKFAIESGAFDSLQTSVSIADQEAIDLTLPLAAKHGMGVIVKRPIANAAWRYDSKPTNAYHVPYWERLQKLNYSFLRDSSGAAATALRFTASQPAVCTMIVGTTKPGRWRENAAALDAGPLPPDQIAAIRKRWSEVAESSWTGQT